MLVNQLTYDQAIQASVYDVTSGAPEFIGIVSNDTKISYMTSPGEHMFMVVGESADFLKASVVEGKTYYTVVSPRMGKHHQALAACPPQIGRAHV